MSTKMCNKCGETKELDLFFSDKSKPDGKTTICKECKKKSIAAWRAANPEKHKNIYQFHNRKYCKNNPDARRESRKEANVGRSKRVRQNTPEWSDMSKIAGIYKKAREMSKEQGIQYHVDHIVPLNNPLVCGLHVPENLQIIPQWENDSKGNKFVDGGNDGYITAK